MVAVAGLLMYFESPLGSGPVNDPMVADVICAFVSVHEEQVMVEEMTCTMFPVVELSVVMVPVVPLSVVMVEFVREAFPPLILASVKVQDEQVRVETETPVDVLLKSSFPDNTPPLE